MKESSLANRTAFAKAHGNLTPAWFSSSRTLCQRCYIITRTKAVRKYHYHDRKVMAAAFAVSCLWNAGRNRYPVSSLLWWVTACQPNGSLSIETYSAALCCVSVTVVVLLKIINVQNLKRQRFMFRKALFHDLF